MRNLKGLQENIKEVCETKSYNLTDILTNDFIRKNTKFTSYDDIVDKSGLVLNETTAEELYSNEELNAFIEANTKFENFKDMCTLAAHEYLAKKVKDI